MLDHHVNMHVPHVKWPKLKREFTMDTYRCIRPRCRRQHSLCKVCKAIPHEVVSETSPGTRHRPTKRHSQHTYRTHTHTHTPTHNQPNTLTLSHTPKHQDTYTPAHQHTNTPTHPHTNTPTAEYTSHANTPTNLQIQYPPHHSLSPIAYIHTHTRTRTPTPTHIHTYTRTPMHTHLQCRCVCMCVWAEKVCVGAGGELVSY
jgi:hypothetical protein